MLNILVACKAPKAPGGLEYAGEHRVLYNSDAGWGAASNALLDRAAIEGGDALFLDDDVTLLPESLAGVREYYDHADLFVLDLHDLSGARQAGARHIMTQDGGILDWVQPGPAYVAHCSTSAIYIKAAAVKTLRFPIWPGIHWEDVALCLDAWLHGFKVLAVPGRVNHDIEGGVGATKRHDARFWERWALNRQHFAGWCAEHDLAAALADGRVPVGARER